MSGTNFETLTLHNRQHLVIRDRADPANLHSFITYLANTLCSLGE